MDLDLDHPVCATCGVQYEPGAERSVCPVCADDREHVAWGGQRWTSRRGLAADGYRTEVREELPGLLGVGRRRTSRSPSGHSWCPARAATSSGTARP